MRNRRMVLVLLLSLTLAGVSPSVGADGGWGIWTDSNQSHTYSFLGNNELRFRYSDQRTVEGVWEYVEGLCWLGPDKRQIGNIVLHVETVECCLNARFLGNKLILSEVWTKGYDFIGSEACRNRVLNRASSPPKK